MGLTLTLELEYSSVSHTQTHWKMYSFQSPRYTDD